MTFHLDIDSTGIDAIERGVRDLSDRAYVLGPMGFKVRDRVLESERRLFQAAPWPGRRPSTIDRYRRPMEHMADEQMHLAPGRGPLERTGVLRHTLTTPQARGQRDTVSQPPGALRFSFGVRARGPVSYALFQAGGHGNRRPRDPFRFDAKAHSDATGDVVDYMIGHYGGRR
ncbi:MAG: hypothetical protein AB7G37_00920 [Solirubrobacteraceae bacterium]